MVYISASGISDFLACSQRVMFRLTQSEQAITTPDMVVGNIVHETIEKFGTDRTNGFLFAKSKIEQFVLLEQYETKAYSCLENYYTHFQNMVSDFDYTEYRFKLPLAKDICLVGKIDRITNETIIDWKTSNKIPKKLSNDVQFIVYNYAYKRLFDKPPVRSYMVSLGVPSITQYVEDKESTNLLFDEIIPHMVDTIKRKYYVKEGRFTGKCFLCPFKTICNADIENVVDSSTFD